MTSPFPDPRATRRAAVAVAALAALVAAALSGAIARRPDAAGAQPAEAFAWRDLGTLPQNLYHRAAAFDAVGHALVLYGGLDVNDTARANIDVVDLADPDLGKAVMRPNLRPLGPVAQLWGAAAAARNIGGRREIVFTGGADAAGNPYDLVQIYDLAANTWTSNRPTGRFDRRVLHGAVFDPGGDQVIVHGGSERCELFPAAGPAICLDPYATTQFLVFDNQSGGLTWVNGPSGPRVYGHSMV